MCIKQKTLQCCLMRGECCGVFCHVGVVQQTAEMGGYMERLVANRCSCRRYLDQNVDPEIISRIIRAMADAKKHIYTASFDDFH